MTISRRIIIGDGANPDEQRWPDPTQLVCPVCRQPVRPEPPAYWRVADGPRPNWSHQDREPLCSVANDDGVRPTIPVTAARTPFRAAEQPKLRFLDHSDYRRSHLLPDDVVCNIPRRPTPGECGAWNVARGLLVEACRATAGRPLALHHVDYASSVGVRPSVSVTLARLRLRTGREVEFVTRRCSADEGRIVDTWTIAINGHALAHEDRAYPPSPVVIGLIVARAIHKLGRADEAEAGGVGRTRGETRYDPAALPKRSPDDRAPNHGTSP
jgi:hypothetical protein